MEYHPSEKLFERARCLNDNNKTISTYKCCHTPSCKDRFEHFERNTYAGDVRNYREQMEHYVNHSFFDRLLDYNCFTHNTRARSIYKRILFWFVQATYYMMCCIYQRKFITNVALICSIFAIGAIFYCILSYVSTFLWDAIDVKNGLDKPVRPKTRFETARDKLTMRFARDEITLEELENALDELTRAKTTWPELREWENSW